MSFGLWFLARFRIHKLVENPTLYFLAHSQLLWALRCSSRAFLVPGSWYCGGEGGECRFCLPSFLLLFCGQPISFFYWNGLEKDPPVCVPTLAIDWLGSSAISVAVSKKLANHQSSCVPNGYTFLPFAFYTFGGFSPEAIPLVARLHRSLAGLMYSRDIVVGGAHYV